ncbi:MAG: hypothetical protein ABIK61_02380 [candidate division WOR-3 bacterium]
MEERPLSEQVVHETIINLIKKSLYNYPNPSQPHLMTFVNHPLRNKVVTDFEGNEYYPDIVIVNTLNNKIVMIGEVETFSSINEEEAKQWQTFANLGPVFYLFYPRGLYEKVKALTKNIKVSGLFEYQKTNDHYTITRHWPYPS